MADDVAITETKALSVRTAFIVHVTDAEAGVMKGRVEHVPSGQSMRFASMAELADFLSRAVHAVDRDEGSATR